MRDPARIDELLDALDQAWRLDPDMRLGQLIVNLARPTEPCPEVFQIEDTVLHQRLHEWIAARRKR